MAEAGETLERGGAYFFETQYVDTGHRPVDQTKIIIHTTHF